MAHSHLAGADGEVAHRMSFGMVLKQWRMSDLPVCGSAVGFARNFLDAAATPPQEEGTTPSPNTSANSFTPSKIEWANQMVALGVLNSA
jgi:hypothetical protein